MSEIDISRDGPVTIVRINRPAQRNAINADTAVALYEAWQVFAADDSARVGILTGSDEVFCAGADLSDIKNMSRRVIDRAEGGPLGCTHLQLSKPTIAAVAGYAVAGGLELACWCDMRVADESAVFGCFERRFGVPLVDGGTWRLPHIVGMGRGLEMILTGRAVHAEEAQRIGLANRVVAQGQHLNVALELAHDIARDPG
jgi:enoyl-CoA hydratase